jgi:L-threonylcarbamoyladenylate synthase
MILPYNEESLTKLSQAILAGELVSLPTDTLQALSCNACDSAAVSKVFALKRRKATKALPVFVSSLAQAQEFAEFDPLSESLAQKFWPGMLTVVLPLKTKGFLAPQVHQGTDKIALRMPKCEPILRLLNMTKVPLVGTSLNLSGEAPVSDVNEIARSFPEIKYVLDYPLITSKNLPSTIVEVVGGKVKVLRDGAIKF